MAEKFTLVRGSDLPVADREIILRLHATRWTKENEAQAIRIIDGAKEPLPDGFPSMEELPGPFLTDDEWLAQRAWVVGEDGKVLDYGLPRSTRLLEGRG